jgi:hypothetical protein
LEQIGAIESVIRQGREASFVTYMLNRTFFERMRRAAAWYAANSGDDVKGK